MRARTTLPDRPVYAEPHAEPHTGPLSLTRDGDAPVSPAVVASPPATQPNTARPDTERPDTERPDTPSRAKPRLRSLDLLRFVAALAVVAFHLSAFTGPSTRPWADELTYEVFPVLSQGTRYGFLGIDLFFLISGFVICMSAWGRSLGEFFVSRAARLYPAFWCAVLFTTAVLAAFPVVRGPLEPQHVLVNLTMFGEPLGVPLVDSVYWTLWVELRFYLLVAAVAAVGLTYRRVLLLCCGWTVVSVLAAPLGEQGGAAKYVVETFVMPRWSPYFVAGMALYLVYRLRHDYRHRGNLLLWAVVGLSWTLAIHHRVSNLEGAESPLHTDLSPWAMSAVVTACFALVGLVAVGWLDWLDHPVATVLGTLTYPLYLIHEFVGWTLIHLAYGPLGRWGALATAAGTVLLVAYAIHRWVERPGQRLLRRKLTTALPSRVVREPASRMVRTLAP